MDHDELVAGWAAAMTGLVYVPRSRDEVEEELARLAARVAEAARAGEASAAVEAGKRLAVSGFTDPECLRLSLERLGALLPEDNRASALAGVAVGFAAGVRERLFAEQQGLSVALLRAKQTIERDLQVSQARFSEVFDTSALGMLITDLGGGVARANRAVESMLGHPRGTLFRKRLEDLFHPDDAAHLRRRYTELVEGRGDHLRERTRFRRADGETLWVRLAVSLLRDADGRPDHHVTMVEDISDLHLLEHRITYQGSHDVLTGLPNRSTFIGRLEESLGAGEDFSVLHLGLDGFAAVDDGIGRPAGDRLLREITVRLIETTGERATVARLGGDEFAVLLRHDPGGPDPAAVAEQINDALLEPTYVDGQGLAVTATIAVAPHPAPDTDPTELLRATDITVRALKARGRRQWGLVDPAEVARLRDRYRLAATLPGAWEGGELDVDYQPVVAMADGRVVAAQAAVWWDHPTRGPLDARHCADLLRDTGLAVCLGRWLLTRAAERLTTRDPSSRLYVDLTVDQAVDPDLVATVHEVGDQTGLTPDRLALGLPVEALSTPDGPGSDNADILADLGVHTVLTEFGRGHGDLERLQDLPIATVRLAQTPVRRVDADFTAPTETLMVRAARVFVPMIRDLGISVLVPDVATEDQALWWQDLGADLAQGPLYGAPGPIEDLPVTP